MYLARLLHFMNPQYYEAATAIELVPAWLRFLQSRGLIDASRRKATIDGFGNLAETLMRLLPIDEDPALAHGLQNWREKAMREVDQPAP